MILLWFLGLLNFIDSEGMFKTEHCFLTVKTSITSENSQQSWQSLESILPIIWKHSNYFICKTMRRKFLFLLNKWPCALYFGTKEMKNGHISLQLLGNSSVTWFSTEAHCHTVILLSVVIQSVIIHFFLIIKLDFLWD